MKFKIVLLSAFLSIASKQNLFSQENRFIEITAIDTIELKPLKFYYQINVQNTSQYNNIDVVMPRGVDSSFLNQAKRKRNNTSAKQIIDVLESNNIHYLISEENTYSINSYNKNNDSTIIATLSSEDELKKIYHLLTSIQNINSHISKIEYESMALYQSTLYSRLYAKAKKEASSIAEISGSSLGQIISIDEGKNLITDFLDEVKNSEMTSAFSGLTKDRDNLNKKVYRKLVFKFQLK